MRYFLLMLPEEEKEVKAIRKLKNTALSHLIKFCPPDL